MADSDGFQMTTLPINAGALAEIASDCREIERTDSQHKTFQRTVVQPIPVARCVLSGLFLIQFVCKDAIETPKVAQFRDSIDFCLPSVLALTQHRCSQDLISSIQLC